MLYSTVGRMFHHLSLHGTVFWVPDFDVGYQGSSLYITGYCRKNSVLQNSFETLK